MITSDKMVIEHSNGTPSLTLRGDTVKQWQLVAMMQAAPDMRRILEEVKQHFATKQFLTDAEIWLLDEVGEVLLRTERAICVSRVRDIGAGHWCAEITLNYPVMGVSGMQHTHFVWSHRGEPERESLENTLNLLLHSHGLYGALQMVREDDCLVKEKGKQNEN